MVEDTNPINVAQKCCSKCNEFKPFDRIVKNRNICKDCCNLRKKEKYNSIIITSNTSKICNTCNQSKPQTSFLKNRNICLNCNNEKRRNRYDLNEEHRLKTIKSATQFKQQKSEQRRKQKLEEIGDGNKKCSSCSIIKTSDRFRYNRLKCKDCERDEPIEKFKRNVRNRIYIALNQKKQMHTIKYLGCTSSEYLKWILTYDERYNLDNRRKEWHIDHVIPLSKFNLENKEEQLIAFNWRNTMPLSITENLSKNKKIIQSQIEQHLRYLKEYHLKNNLEIPLKFIDLFAKHLDAGNPLEPSLPLTRGNLCEELG